MPSHLLLLLSRNVALEYWLPVFLIPITRMSRADMMLSLLKYMYCS